MNTRKLLPAAIVLAIIALVYTAHVKISTIRRQQDLNAALINAVYHNDLGDVNAALAQGADPEAREPRDLNHPPSLLNDLIHLFQPHHAPAAPPMTPLVEAVGHLPSDYPMTAGEALHEHIAVITTLLDHHADIEAGPNGAGMPLMIASRNGMPQTVRLLLGRGANVNTATPDGLNALMCAVQIGGCTEIVRMLLEHGADVNAKSRIGQTALMIAAQQWEQPEFVQLLRSHGADCNARDQAGQTVLTLAQGVASHVTGNKAGVVLVQKQAAEITGLLKKAGEKE